MNLSQCIIEGFRIFPDSEALFFEGDRYSYADLERLSGKAAVALRDLGVEKGDRVALRLPNLPAFPVWYYGALRIGAIAVSVNTRLAPDEVEFILGDCGAELLVTAEGEESPEDFDGRTVFVSEDGATADGKSLEEGKGLSAGEYLDCDPDDPAIILYTSGTTGFPKGATLSHRNVRATVHAFNHLCRMGPGDRLLLVVPLFHCYGQNAILNAGLNVGAAVVMQRRFDLNEAIGLIRDERVTKLFGVPTTFQLMRDACDAGDLSTIDYCFCAAATLAPQLGDSWAEKFGMPIYEGYGLTETAPFASYNHPLRHIPGSIGVPVDLVEMRVVDPETGDEVPDGETGEIVVRGPNVMLGYWNRPEETAEAVRDGWFHSGDIGRRDERGCFYIVDRIKDMIAVGGMKVFPSEVERVMLDAPGVGDCAVVGFPDPVWGECVVGFVVDEDGGSDDSRDAKAASSAIRNWCLEHLASYKVPGQIVFVDELPRNPAGKVLKKELRKHSIDPSLSAPVVVDGEGDAGQPDRIGRLLQSLRSTHASARERTLISFLQAEIQSLTGSADPPAVDTALLETGMDSVMMVSLSKRLQEELGPDLELPATLVFDYPRIGDLARYLIGALGLGEGGERKTARENANPPATASTDEKSIEDMSEQEAMEALMKELDE